MQQWQAKWGELKQSERCVVLRAGIDRRVMIRMSLVQDERTREGAIDDPVIGVYYCKETIGRVRFWCSHNNKQSKVCGECVHSSGLWFQVSPQ